MTPEPGALASWSATVGEIARFSVWSFHRLFSRGRILVTALLLAAVVAGPFLIFRFGLAGWVWSGLTLLLVAAFGIILLASYLRVSFRHARAVQAEGVDLLAEEGRREQARLQSAIDLLEARQARTVAQMQSLNEERQSVLERRQDVQCGRLQSQVTGVEEGLGALDGRLRLELSDHRRDIESAFSARQEALESGLASLRADTERFRDELAGTRSVLKDELGAAQGEARKEWKAGLQDLASHLAERLDGLETASRASAWQLVRTGREIDERFQREESRRTRELADSLGRLEANLAEQVHRADASVVRLRELINRRVDAGGEAVRSEIAELQAQLPSMVEAVIHDLRGQLDRIETMKSDLDELRGSVRRDIEASEQKSARVIETAVATESERRESDLTEHARQQTAQATALVAGVRARLDEKLGAGLETRLDEWRARLDNEIASALQAGRVEDQAAAHAREQSIISELRSLQKEMLAQKQAGTTKEEIAEIAVGSVKAISETLTGEVQAGTARLVELTKATESAEQRLSAQEASAAKAQQMATAQLAAVTKDASESVKALEARLSASSQAALEKAQAAFAAANEAQAEAARTGTALRDLETRANSAPEALKALEASVRSIDTRSQSSTDGMRKLTDANAMIARPFDRMLATDKLERISQHWLKMLGLNMNRTSLAYLAHKICLLEDRGLGRIAAPIETIMMRQLALRSLPGRGRLEVLEIGALFGLSAAVLHSFQGARTEGMFMTLLDPLEGYYEVGHFDPVTGIEVSEAVLRKNLATLDVPRSDYRLIKERSVSVSAIKAASDRLYDFVLIDGDHSTAGVAADFENYGPLVRPGGMIIFDDYGSDHWPGIQPYVDEVVRADPNWVWIGADYRTAILTKKADGLTAKIAQPSPPRGRKSPPGKPPKASGSAAAVKPRRSGR